MSWKIEGSTFSEAYNHLLKCLFYSGIEELNERTGSFIKALPGGYSFKIDMSNARLPVAGNRRYWPHIAAAEVAWQFMGTKDPAFIMKHAPKIWSKFIEEGEIKAAYGYRWMHHFGRDQLAMALKQLREKPTNRQLFITAWDPSHDGLGGPNQPMNIPCPVGFTLSILAGKLHMSLFIRSSDVFVGLPYDVMGYGFLLDAFAASCGKKPGTLHVTLAHPHIYKAHYEMLDRSAKEGENNHWLHDVEPQLPAWTIDGIIQNPEGYIEQVKTLCSRVETHTWNPAPMVII